MGTTNKKSSLTSNTPTLGLHFLISTMRETDQITLRPLPARALDYLIILIDGQVLKPQGFTDLEAINGY